MKGAQNKKHPYQRMFDGVISVPRRKDVFRFTDQLEMDGDICAACQQPGCIVSLPLSLLA